MLQAVGVKRPIEFHTRSLVAQHGHADAVAGFERGVIVDEDAFEVWGMSLREDCQGEVAEVAVVALEEDQWHTVSY